MTRLSHMEQRLEFLELGEKLGWPRIGRLRAGKGNWEGTARAEHRRFVGFLRAAKIRVENLHGEYESDLARTVLFGDVLKGLADAHQDTTAPQPSATTTSQAPHDRGQTASQTESAREAQRESEHREAGKAEGGRQPEKPPLSDQMVRPPKYTAAMRRANLAKAREAKKAKAAMA